MWHQIFWIAAGFIALLVAGAIAMNIKEAKLGVYSSRLIAVLLAGYVYFAVPQLSELWPIPTFSLHWLDLVVPLAFLVALLFFFMKNWGTLVDEVGELLWSSASFIFIALFMVAARYCFHTSGI